MLFSSLGSTLVSLVISLGHVAAQDYGGAIDPRVKVAITFDSPINGVSTTPDGRIFAVVAHVDGSTGPLLIEYDRKTNSSTAFPNSAWNSYAPGKNPATHFLRVNSQRIGPDGKLYAVDVGSPAFGQPVNLPYGPKVVVIDLETNQVSRVYPMGNATRSYSLIDDIRFHNATGKAYITDAGSAGIIILDLTSGITKRVLDNDPSTRGVMPISGEGAILRSTNGQPAFIAADQLEVSPDGQWFYYQPAQGGMFRIGTQYLDAAFYNSSLSEGLLAQYTEPFALTPSTGGTAIDAHGNIYSSDTDNQQILRIAPNGTKSLLTQDPRLLWVDAMWVDTHGLLWMPAAQLNRGTPFGNGKSNITKPLHVYTIDIGIGPSPIDHA